MVFGLTKPPPISGGGFLTEYKMENILNCFGDIIGLTQEHDSDSGLYITDLEAVESIYAVSKTDLPFNLIDKVSSARRVAILKLHTDLTTLMMRYAEPRKGFQGLLGGSRFTSLLSETGISGLRVLCRPIRDAELVIKGINTVFGQTGVINVNVASNYSDDIETYTLDTEANKTKVNTLAESLVLPLYDENEDEYVEYYIYHDNSLAAANNRIKCSTCGTKFTFDTQYPTFKEVGYKQYLNIAGFNTDDIANIDTKGHNYAKGLQLNIDIRCRTDKAICNEEIDFLTNPMAMSFATAIQYKAGSVVIWDLIRSNDLNRITMGDIESFRDAASYYERKYNDMVKYISENMLIESDCFCLKKRQRIRRP